MKHIESVGMDAGQSMGPGTGALIADAAGLVVNAVILVRLQDLEPEEGHTVIMDFPEHVGIGWRWVDARWEPPAASEAPAPYQPDQATLWS